MAVISVRITFKLRNNYLYGKVYIRSLEVLTILVAYLEIVGIASCNWKFGKIRFKFPHLYTDHTSMKNVERFYYTRHKLCGGEVPQFHSGQEFYTFKCYWPSRLPGTWFGDHGSIEYIGKVTMRLKDDIVIYTHSQAIHVGFLRQLEVEKHLLLEGRVKVTRHFYTTRSLGNIHVNVWTPICGIAAGQSLPVICTVVNHSELHFGSLLFVLTRIDVYRSHSPLAATKKVRTDVCRVARMVDIHKGQHDYYSIVQTNEDAIPTIQFPNCKCIQVIYELWVSVQGAFPRYKIFGYPNIDTPGIPIMIGTSPLRRYEPDEITSEIFKKMYEYQGPVLLDVLPDEDVKQMIDNAEEELSKTAVENLERQLKENERLLELNKRELKNNP